jgi:glucan phosphoethanolaminetransferase (alkaline phosphatase superfamily)
MTQYTNHLILLIKRLGIAFLAFTICRILFYSFNNIHFSDVSIDLFFYGIRFDIVAIAFIYSPLILLHLIPLPFKNFKWFYSLATITFYTLNTLAIAINLIDVAYFDFTLKRTTTDFFGMVGTGDDFFKLLPHYIIDFWYNYLLFAGLLIISWFLNKKFCRSNKEHQSFDKKDYLFQSIIFIVFSTLTIFGMRGGFQYKPIDIVNAGQYAKAQNIPIVLNTPFTIIKTILVNNIESITYYSDEKVEEIYTPKTIINGNGYHKGKNVVLVILESFAKEYVGGFNKGKGYTPFIDSLLNESYVFTNAYANGSRSIEALPCLLAGIPQLMAEPYVLSNYAGNQIQGFPEILKEDGYNTSFYHGGANGTMGFNGFVGVAGIDNYFGLNEYPFQEKDYDGLWGIFDEPYLQYFASELNNKQEPFFSSVFTVSSHHPYTIPKGYTGKFPKGTLPLHETIGYTDFALKRFFKTAQKMPWFKNTIFVFTADHSSQSNTPIYKTRLGRFAVPVFIYDPSNNLQGENPNIFQHIDISPTILGLISSDKKIISFGNNALSNNDKFAIQYVNSTYQIATEENFLIFDGEKTSDFYNLKTDSLLTNNLLGKLTTKQKVEKDKLENKLKAIIQQYNNRLINNQLSTSNQQHH